MRQHGTHRVTEPPQIDTPNCYGNCLVPDNKAPGVKEALYPNANSKSGWWIAPVAGHGLEFRYVAAEAHAHIPDVVKSIGF